MERRSDRIRTRDRQPDLFAPTPRPARGITPSWSSLPQQTRRTLTGLVTRLLVEHAGGGATRGPRSNADEF